MQNEVPEITFQVYPRNSCPDWLMRKKERLETKWNNNCYGKRLVAKVIKTCNLTFPNRVNKQGITVTFYRHSSKKHGESVGFLFPTEPSRISLCVKKKATCKALLSDLCHELIHCLLWSRYYFDNRRKRVSFFADAVADELIITLLEETIMKGSFRKIDFKWALDYARDQTYLTLRNLKKSKGDYDKVVKELKVFYREAGN